MKCPKCNANVFKKKVDKNGVEYYRCSACHYESHHIKTQLEILKIKYPLN
jgi:transposase-like protein